MTPGFMRDKGGEVGPAQLFEASIEPAKLPETDKGNIAVCPSDVLMLTNLLNPVTQPPKANDHAIFLRPHIIQ